MNHKPLKGFGAFATVFRNGTRITSGPVLCCYTVEQTKHRPIIEVGVGISKKNSSRAVDRNRIKRVLRAAFRNHAKTLDHHMLEGLHLKMIFVWRTTPNIPNQISTNDVQSHIERILSRVIEAGSTLQVSSR